jgi:hypothetical protein
METFLKNRKFQGEIMLAGQKRGWSFAPPPQKKKKTQSG